MDASFLVNLVVPTLIALAVAGRGFVVDESYVARWASSAGLTLTDENRPEIHQYLTWSRRLRTVGGLLGFLGPLIVAHVAHAAFAFDVASWDLGGLSSLLIMVGYLLGTVVAELAINRPAGQAGDEVPGSDRLADYLPRYIVLIQRGLGVLCLVLVGAYALASPLAEPLDPSTLQIAVFGLVGTAVAALLEGIQRIVIGRRQVMSGPDVAVDDAKRSTTVHVVAGTGTALLLFFVAGLLAAFLTLLASPTSAIGLSVIVILFPVSIFFWLDSGRPHGFRVVRRERLGANS